MFPKTTISAPKKLEVRIIHKVPEISPQQHKFYTTICRKVYLLHLRALRIAFAVNKSVPTNFDSQIRKSVVKCT